MAGSDYGCICYKNGVKIPFDEYDYRHKMERCLGGYKCNKDTRGRFINGNFRVYLGDKKFYIGVWKCWISIFSGNHFIRTIYGVEDVYPMKSFRRKVTVNGITFDIKRIGDAQFKLRFHYKNDTYVVVYGYGVGDNVFNWWGGFLGLSSKKARETLKWYKHCKFV